MKKNVFLLIYASLLLFTGVLWSQTEQEIHEISLLLNQERYASLVNKVCSLREKAYYKNPFMDYCLAYGYCQLGHPQISAEWFDHLMNNYNSIPAEKKRELNQLKNTCLNPPEEISNQTNNAENMISFLNTMNRDGFEGNQAGIEMKMGIPSLTDRVTELDFEHAIFDTKNRQFNQQQKSLAYNYFKGKLNDDSFACDSTEHLLIFYSGSAVGIKNQVTELENYYKAISQTFNLGESNRLISIFYCPDRHTLNKVSGKIHNMTLPASTFGYASSADLVMLGIANKTWLGAMKHELFHIMIRSFIGDIPAWLDEGLACCYESSSLKENMITIKVNLDNYRTNLLLDLDEVRYNTGDYLPLPTVEQFTNFSWQQFSGNPGDLKIKASINYSISFVFVKFLLDKNILVQVVDAFRNRTLTQIQAQGDQTDSLTIMRIRPANAILTEIAHQDINQMQSSFEDYFKLSFNRNPYNN